MPLEEEAEAELAVDQQQAVAVDIHVDRRGGYDPRRQLRLCCEEKGVQARAVSLVITDHVRHNLLPIQGSSMPLVNGFHLTTATLELRTKPGSHSVSLSLTLCFDRVEQWRVGYKGNTRPCHIARSRPRCVGCGTALFTLLDSMTRKNLISSPPSSYSYSAHTSVSTLSTLALPLISWTSCLSLSL